MKYKYPPIYKYGFLLIIIYLLLKHQKIMQQNKLLINSILITLIIGVIDYIIIEDHPMPLDNVENDKKNKEDFDVLFENDEDMEEIINSYDVSIDESIENDY